MAYCTARYIPISQLSLVNNSRQRNSCLFLFITFILIFYSHLSSAAQNDDGQLTPLNKASELLSKKEYHLAFEEYKTHAEQDNGLAQFTLALFYSNAWGKKLDNSKACYWYHKAAINNIPAAQQALGNCYLIGLLGNKKQALNWYEKAYQSGIYFAACQAGELYLSGEYAPLNKEKGLALCVQAANGGSVEAMTMLGKWYFSGQYVEKDLTLAFNILHDAAKNNGAEAAYYLARFYDQGIQTRVSVEDALHWYEKSASRGFKKAYLPTSALYLKMFEEESITNKKGELLAKTYLWAYTSTSTLIEQHDKKLAKLILNKVNKEMPDTWKQDLNSKVQEHITKYH